jgi:hypothetical protein
LCQGGVLLVRSDGGVLLKLVAQNRRVNGLASENLAGRLQVFTPTVIEDR